jgi:hypothetical protein
VLSANDPRPGAQAELLHVMQLQAVEISRAKSAFSVDMPVRRTIAQGGGRGRGGRGGAAPTDSNVAQAGQTRTETHEFPAGNAGSHGISRLWLATHLAPFQKKI